MSPLPFSPSSTLHTLLSRATNPCDQPSSPQCKPATPRQTIIIAAVCGTIALLTIIFAMWYWNCLCCLSRKRYQRVRKDEETPGKSDVVTLGTLESAGQIGNKGGGGTKTTALSGIGGGHTGSNFGFGGGGRGGGGSSLDCAVM